MLYEMGRPSVRGSSLAIVLRKDAKLKITNFWGKDRLRMNKAEVKVQLSLYLHFLFNKNVLTLI